MATINDQTQPEKNFTSFSLSRELIENAFSKKLNRPKILAESKVASENGGTQKCDKCEYKTNKVILIYDHIVIKHSEVKHKCKECDYQHHYPNRVRSHLGSSHGNKKEGI